jgi:3-hydroxyacyl-[acyl-carrier-protein] dehydratase
MTIEYDFTVSDDHPSLAGHFPGNPVVPGAVVLDEAMAGLRRHAGGRIFEIRRAKFHLPLPVNETCRMRAERREGNIYAVSCTADGNLILSVILRCGDGAAQT